MGLRRTEHVHIDDLDAISACLSRKDPVVISGFSSPRLTQVLQPEHLLQALDTSVLERDMPYTLLDERVLTREEILQRFINDEMWSTLYTNQQRFLTRTEYQRLAPSPFHQLSFYRDRLQTSKDADFSWYYIGGEGSGTTAHIDCYRSSAFLLLMQGRKLWYSLSGRHHHHLSDASFEVMDALIRQDDGTDEMWQQLKIPDEFRAFDIFRAVLQKDEIYVTPKDALHAVRNLERSVSITHNFFERQWLDEYCTDLTERVEESSIDDDDLIWINELLSSQSPLP